MTHPVFAFGIPHGSEWLIIFFLVIALFHFVGALLYFLIRRPQRIRELGH
jgi:preprotein translocase subunit YajC